nr:hypothetical protein CFP56_69105 [Quercus suber]
MPDRPQDNSKYPPSDALKHKSWTSSSTEQANFCPVRRESTEGARRVGGRYRATSDRIAALGLKAMTTVPGSPFSRPVIGYPETPQVFAAVGIPLGDQERSRIRSLGWPFSRRSAFQDLLLIAVSERCGMDHAFGIFSARNNASILAGSGSDHFRGFQKFPSAVRICETYLSILATDNGRMRESQVKSLLGFSIALRGELHETEHFDGCEPSIEESMLNCIHTASISIKVSWCHMHSWRYELLHCNCGVLSTTRLAASMRRVHNDDNVERRRPTVKM